MVGWGVAGGVGWLGKRGRLEYQRVTNHGGGGRGLADGNPRAQDGGTPLHSAAWMGHEAFVGALLMAGADKEAKEVRGGRVQGEVRGGRVQGESGVVRCGSQ